jgi:rhodanese-related sulfurtransferase
VRTPGEVAEGAIDGAVNIDFNGDDFESEISKLDKDTPVYVYCHGGGRSGNAMNMMKDLGFSEVYNLVDGYGNWPYKK